jgi:transposase
MKTHQPRGRTSPPPRSAVLERMNANVAGIDCNATHLDVAVPVDRAPMPVQSFPTVTSGLRRLVDWLVACRVTSVAMEAQA